MTSPNPLLKIENASVVRSGTRILDKLSLTVDVGQHTAIIGPNGSGKSTLIKLITRRYYPLVGEHEHPVVEIFGKDRWDIFQLQSMLGILSADLHQSFINDPEVTAYEAALSGFFASQGTAAHQVVTNEMHERATQELHRVGAWHLRDKKIARMSTGEVRRALIARALVARPSALLLDEPTTGLDMSAMKKFLTTVRHIAQSGKTIILITHAIAEVIPEIERVVLMKDGKIFRDGPKSEILTSENLSSLFCEAIYVQKHGEFYSAMLSD